MNSCPNKSLKEYKILEQVLGEKGVFALYIANGEVLPTLEQAEKIVALHLSNTDSKEKKEIDKIVEEVSNKIDNDVIVKSVEDFFETTKSRLSKLIKNKNYSKLKELFTDTYGVNKYDSLQSLLRDANSAVEDEVGIKRRVRALVIGIVEKNNWLDLIKDSVKDISQNNIDSLDNIKTLQYYLLTLEDWKNFLKDARTSLSESKELSKVIDNAIGKIEEIDNIIIKNDIAGVVTVLKPLLAPASDKYINYLNERKSYYEKLASNTKNTEKKTQYKEIVKGLSTKIEQFNFNIDDNIAEFLKGKRGDSNAASFFFEAFSDSADPIIGGFANFIKDNISEVSVEAKSIERDYLNDLAPIYKKLGEKARFNPEEVNSKIVFEDNRVNRDGEGYKVISLLNPHKDYQADEQIFNNKIQELKELITEGVDVEENSEELSKVKKEYGKWKLEYMHQEFTDKFYKKYELWEDEVGQKLKEKVDFIFSHINQLHQVAQLTGTELTETELNEIDNWLKEYKLLGSLVTLDGSAKTGEALKEAERMQEIRRLNGELFEFKDNIQAFDRAKQRHSEYLLSQNIEQDSPEYEKEMNKWEENNTRTVIDKSFYEDRQVILQKINDILSVLNTEEDNSDFADIWKEILDITYGHRDEDNQPIGTEITEKATEKIKVLQERLEAIKESLTQSSGLSRIEQNRLSELIDKLKDKSINSVEQAELKELFDRQKSNGLPESYKKKLAVLFEELKDLQSKIPTDYYVDSFNNLSQKYGVTLDETGNIVEGDVSTPILDSPKLNTLLKEEDFKDWFYKNHIQVKKFNPDTQEVEDKWQRLYQWNRVVPNDKKYISTKPSLKYSYRTVKDEYRTEQIVGKTVDIKGKFLPKSDVEDKKYINEEYFRLKNSTNPIDKELFKLLEVHTNYLLKTQEDLINRNKLSYDIPKILKSKTERYSKALKDLYEKPKEIPSIVWGGIVSKFKSFTEFDQDEGNFESVFADKNGREFTTVPIKFVGKRPIEDTSLDLFKAIMKYTYSTKLNKKLIELTPVANALQRIVGQPTHQPLNLKKFIKGKLSKNPVSGTNTRASAIKAMITREFEGQKKKMEGGKYIEAIKEFIVKLVVLKSIKFNIPSSIANVVNAEVQNFVNASNGRISRSDLGKAHSVFFSQYLPAFFKDYAENKINKSSLQAQMFDLYGFVQSHSTEDSLGEKISTSKIKDFIALKWLTSHREWGEMFVQSLNALAYLNSVKVNQDGNTISLLDAYELDSNGKIKLKDGVQEDYSPNSYKQKELKKEIEKHNRLVHGNYAKGIDRPESDTYTTYSIIFLMKRFFIYMALNRFGSTNHKFSKYGIESDARFSTIGEPEHGFYIQTLDIFAKELRSKVETGEFNKLTINEKRALSKAAYEALLILSFGLILKYLLGFDPDDDDKYKKLAKNSWITNQLIYQVARLQTETSTFSSLDQYVDFILGSPFAGQTLKTWGELIQYSIGNLKGDEKSYYKRNEGIFKKGESKAKARLYKVTGIQQNLMLMDDDELTKSYLKMRER